MHEIAENAIAADAVDCAFKLHSRYGPGIYESVYEALMAYEMRQRGYEVKVQQRVTLTHDGITFDEAFRLDLLINDLLLLELKSVEKVIPVHKKQVLTYLKLANLRLGLLMNFGEEYIKDGIFRIVNGLPS